jgi:diguanylate cyclase (GGDEF)-like protein
VSEHTLARISPATPVAGAVARARVATCAAAALAVAGAAALAAGSQSGAGLRLLALLAVLGGVALLVLQVWRRTVALRAHEARARAEAARIQAVFDALPYGIVVWDADDGLELANADFRRIYASAGVLRSGERFETLLRRLVGQGAVPQAAGDVAGWLEARLREHAAPDGQPRLRRMSDGRWREVFEQRLCDGRLLAHSRDVTEREQREHALLAAQQAAALATQRLQDAIEALPEGFELYDADDRLVLVNAPMRALYPLIDDLADRRPTFDEVVRTHHARGGLQIDAAGLDDYIATRRRERRAGPSQRLVQLASGRWVRSHEQPTREGGVVGVRIDVTELVTQRTAAEAAQRDAELARARLEDAIQALPDAFALFDAQDRLVIFNARYLEVYAASADQMRAGVTFEQLLRAGLAAGQYPQAVGREDSWLAERLQAHRNPTGPFTQELPGNRWLRIDERRTREGGVAGVRIDITELVRRGQALQQLNEELDRLNAELRQLSETDELTGLANRRVLQRRLTEEVARAQRHRLPLALLMVDIDHFKRFNDRHGHPAGDACLVRVARLLAEHARRPADLAARVGGEEFALLLPHTAAVEAMALAEQLVAACDRMAVAHGDSPTAAHVTLSVGVATAQPPADDQALLRRADEALYAAKGAGRRRAVHEAGTV